MENNTEEEEEEIEKAQSVSPRSTRYYIILFRLSSLLLTQGSEPAWPDDDDDVSL